MRIQRTSQVITVSVVFFSLLTVASAVVSLRYRTLQEANYAARRAATGRCGNSARAATGSPTPSAPTPPPATAAITTNSSVS